MFFQRVYNIFALLSVLHSFANCKHQRDNCLRAIENLSTSFSISLEAVKEPKVNNPQNFAKNCFDLQKKGDRESGIRTIYPFEESPTKVIEVVCDQETDEGGWLVLQRRDDLPFREDFYRTWFEYSLGFGNLNGEFWLGLNSIHALTSNVLMELRVDLEDSLGEKAYAKYSFISVGSAEEKFILNIGNYTAGDAGDSLKYHNKMKFTTKDEDNDKSSENCAENHKGAWWYNGCHNSNLNGFQYVGNFSATRSPGIVWKDFRGYKNSMKSTSMKIRPALRYSITKV